MGGIRGRSSEIVIVRQWKITASPLPFVDILLDFPFSASFGNFTVTAPLPEAFFVHKLITSQRRLDESKRYKDLEQCAAIARQIDEGRLKRVVRSLGTSKKTQKALLASCKEIGFPPQMVGLE